MAVDRAAVVHDSASVYRFIDSVCALARDGSASVYVPASQKFFDYVSALGDKTKAYLVDFPTALPANEYLQHVYRQKLTILRDSWSELHQYLKPAVDADTLNTPFSLLSTLYRRFHKLRGFEKVEFTVFHLNDVNYHQVRASWFKQLATRIGSGIPNAPHFPDDLGLIGIPYSQSSALFLNCLIPHEMGHYVWQQLDHSNTLLPEINSGLDADPNAASLTTNDRRWCIDKLNSWAEEIFCDLFAVSMVGPAFVFACIELLDLAKISTTTTSSPLTEPLEFDSRHPSDAFRLFSSARLLEQLGWWEHVSKYKSHYIEILKFVRTIPQRNYLFPCDKPQFEHLVLNTFFRIQAQVAELLAEVVKELPSGSEDYAKHETDIQDYLHVGVVPSTILKTQARPGTEAVFAHPDPISLLNVAYKIHLESIGVLMAHVGEAAGSVSARSLWTQNLELWTAKALEDYSLLVVNEGREGLASQDVGTL